MFPNDINLIAIELSEQELDEVAGGAEAFAAAKNGGVAVAVAVGNSVAQATADGGFAKAIAADKHQSYYLPHHCH